MSQTLSVVRVIARLNIGGPARHVVTLNDRLRSFGDRTLLVHGSVGAHEGSLEDLATARRLDVVKIAELGRRVHVWGDVSAFLKVLGILFRAAPDVVHTHTAKAGALGRLAASIYNMTRSHRTRCAIVHTYHGHVFHGYFGQFTSLAVRVIERLLAKLTDVVVTISPEQCEELTTRFRIVPRSKAVVIRLGLELDELLGLPPPERRGKVVFGYVGRLVPVKELDTVVRAFAVARAHVPGCRLVLAGDGESRAALERMVNELDVGEAVTFAGWHRDLCSVYRGTDVAVLSSRNEGTPVSLIEAMAAGRPVIATRVGGVPDVVSDGDTGLLVPRGDVDGFAQAMIRLARDAAERTAMGRAGRQRVRDRYSAERLAHDTRLVYTEAVRKRRGDPGR